MSTSESSAPRPQMLCRGDQVVQWDRLVLTSRNVSRDNPLRNYSMEGLLLPKLINHFLYFPVPPCNTTTSFLFRYAIFKLMCGFISNSRVYSAVLLLLMSQRFENLRKQMHTCYSRSSVPNAFEPSWSRVGLLLGRYWLCLTSAHV